MPGWDYDYLLDTMEKLEQMLEDDDIYREHDDETHLNFAEADTFDEIMKAIAHEIPISTLTVIFFILTPFVTVGLTRHVFMTKSMALFVASLTRILLLVVIPTTPNQQQWEEIKKLVVIPTTPNQQQWEEMERNNVLYIFHTRQIGAIVLALANMIAAFDECSSLILTWELFQCVAKMEKRKYNFFSFLKMQSISFVILILYYGLPRLDLLSGSVWWQLWFVMAVPFSSLFSLLILSLICYYGIQTLMALGKSDQFQNGNSTEAGSGKKRQHLVFVIYVLMSAQFFKFVSQIVRVGIWTTAVKNVDDCEKISGDLKNDENCLHSYTSTWGYSKVGHDYCGTLEIVVVLCIFIHKNCLKKA